LEDEDAIGLVSQLVDELDGGLSFNDGGAECAAYFLFREREARPTAHATTVAIKISAFKILRVRVPAAETLSRND
jgi:hypothetical protein